MFFAAKRKRVSTVARRAGLALATAVLLALAGLAWPPDAQGRKPRRTHVVEPGESVAAIADFYGVSQRDLRELNGLKKGRPLRVGRKLKIPNVLRVEGRRYVVERGDTLASIAERFGSTAGEVAHANKIDDGRSLQVGRTLVIPDGKSSAKRIDAKKREIEPITFLRVRNGERARLRLYSRRGEVNKWSVMRLSRLCRDKKGGAVKRLHFRLVKMIQLVAEEFPNKPIEIISGYRAHRVGGNESQHAFGRALDFRIPGVQCRQIWRFCKSLPRSGCGYYPNDGFVHMDAREKSAIWVKR
jgi:uncharacterized protein YcbK (DUF882 family)